MLKNTSTKTKLMILPFIFVCIVIISGVVFTYYNNISLKRSDVAVQTEVFIQNVLKGRISVYQFLRKPVEEKAQKVRDDFAYLNNNVIALQDKLSIQENIVLSKKIVKLSKEYIRYFDKFASKRIIDYKNGVQKESKEITDIIKQMVKIGIELEKDLALINKSAVELKNDAIKTMDMILIAIALVSSILFIFLSLMISNVIIKSLANFQNGLNTFFRYLNRESDEVLPLDDSINDEFGQMAKTVNISINQTKAGIEEDRKLIDETITVLSEFEQGDLCQRLNMDVSNPALMELKTVLNKMGENMENNIDNILDILEQYSNYNYLNKIDKTGLKEHLLSLANGVNDLGDSITQMLIENKQNGLSLDESSDILLSNVDILNKNSNEAAAALEETAAALEQITSNISHNTENVVKMSGFAKALTKSAKEGENLASQTTKAMDEINGEVTSINEAITVIDQIAFQTNILSLNAAVEAATAGEAGKGFAVVAGEVRNLAARSAEAASEIKTLVENATSKANYGKDISDKMIDGYSGLNENISKTLELISDVEMASKEQQNGIEQINDAVTSLDQQTQENASIASRTHDVAVDTDSIAKLVVSNANEKEFDGKDKVQAKKLDSYEKTKEPVKRPEIKTSPKVSNPKVLDNSDNTEWESF